MDVYAKKKGIEGKCFFGAFDDKRGASFKDWRDEGGLPLRKLCSSGSCVLMSSKLTNVGVKAVAGRSLAIHPVAA